MLPDRATALRSLAAIVAVTVVGLLFIASYAGALHNPQPHAVPVAVVGPPRLVAALEGASALKVVREPDAAAAQRRSTAVTSTERSSAARRRSTS